ncbi:CHAP domain-containing protein [Streptosporangium sp. NPDC050855]|uniref:CHAP domain-containing protein n=1 Tax=Streptosporangium sp. NPDC050855 TaxID=3366194 RepID=UPI0037960A15
MQKFIELLESQLGYSEKSGGYTKFGSWYGKTVEFDADYTSAPWCDMYLSWAAKQLGYEAWVGQFAYTVYHAEWFREQDAWGTTPKPGAIVFFDWGGSDSIDRIDHVGIVTAVEGGRIHTIEGNIDGGVAKRKQRETDKVVGYGYPEKIKARLDREARQETIQNPATVNGPVGPTTDAPGLVAVVPTPAPTRSSTGSGTGSGTTKASPKHARKPAEQAGEQGHRPADGDRTSSSEKGDTRPGDAAETPKSTTGTKAGVQAKGPAVAGRTAQGKQGKHAKASTADTSALATTPVAASGDLTGYTPELGTPAVLAPVLLAAVAILAHTKAKQSRLRFAAAAERAVPVAPPRRSPGRRRAPGRRRMPRNAPVTARLVGRPQELVPATTSFTPAAAAEFPAVTAPVDVLEETRARTPRDDRARAPYQGRRRLHERPVVESSTFVQDAPLRGRRHRRSDSMVSTTIAAGPAGPAPSTTSAVPARPASPGGPRVPAGPAVPTVSARSAAVGHPASAPGATAVSVPAPHEGRGRPVTRTGPYAPPAESGDILVHSGYRGRRRARVPA